MKEDQRKEYTGSWIPAHIMMDNELSPSSKILYAEIASFRICFASNAFLAERLGISESGVQKILRKLRQKGYIKLGSFDGRKRTLVCVRDVPESMAEVDYSPPIDNSIDNSIDTLPIGKVAQEPKGKTEINQLFEEWHLKTGIPISGKEKANRYAANNLLKKHGYAKCVQLIAGVALAQQDRYAPRISDFTQLQSKLTDLLTWGKTKQTKQEVNMVEV